MRQLKNKKAQEQYEFLLAIFNRIENEYSKKDLIKRFDKLIELLEDGAELGKADLKEQEYKKVQDKAEQLTLF